MLQDLGQLTQLSQAAHVLMAKEDHAAYVLAPQYFKKLSGWRSLALKRQQKLLPRSLFQRHRIFWDCISHRRFPALWLSRQGCRRRWLRLGACAANRNEGGHQQNRGC